MDEWITYKGFEEPEEPEKGRPADEDTSDAELAERSEEPADAELTDAEPTERTTELTDTEPTDADLTEHAEEPDTPEPTKNPYRSLLDRYRKKDPYQEEADPEDDDDLEDDGIFDDPDFDDLADLNDDEDEDGDDGAARQAELVSAILSAIIVGIILLLIGLFVSGGVSLLRSASKKQSSKRPSEPVVLFRQDPTKEEVTESEARITESELPAETEKHVTGETGTDREEASKRNSGQDALKQNSGTSESRVKARNTPGPDGKITLGRPKVSLPEASAESQEADASANDDRKSDDSDNADQDYIITEMFDSAGTGNGDFEVDRPTVKAASEGPAADVSEVVGAVMPAMAAVCGVSAEEYEGYRPRSEQDAGVFSSSGMIVSLDDESVLILTDQRAMLQEALTAVFSDGTYAPAHLIGANKESGLAMLAVAASELSEETISAIRTIEFGDSDTLTVGQTVLAVGNTPGSGQSVSAGIVSATGRKVQDEFGLVHELIQTDASIHQGNSCGALLNSDGELVGINDLKISNNRTEGVGYALPLSEVLSVIDNLIRRAHAEEVTSENAGYLALRCVTVPHEYILQGYPAGICVTETLEGGPAQTEGIRAQDIITIADGVRVSDRDSLAEILSGFAAGQVITLTVRRLNDDRNSFEEISFDVTLGSSSDLSDGVGDEISSRIGQDYGSLFGEEEDNVWFGS